MSNPDRYWISEESKRIIMDTLRESTQPAPKQIEINMASVERDVLDAMAIDPEAVVDKLEREVMTPFRSNLSDLRPYGTRKPHAGVINLLKQAAASGGMYERIPDVHDSRHKYVYHSRTREESTNLHVVTFLIIPIHGHSDYGPTVEVTLTHVEMRTRTIRRVDILREEHAINGRTFEGMFIDDVVEPATRREEREPLPPTDTTEQPTCRRCAKPNLEQFMTSKRDQSTVCKPCFTIMQSAGVGYEKP